MTDIWRSFIAQRILWEYGYGILFHSSTVYQNRNDHNLIEDFEDEIPGYLNNGIIFRELVNLKLSDQKRDIIRNLQKCYKRLIDIKVIGKDEIKVLKAWEKDIENFY